MSSPVAVRRSLVKELFGHLGTRGWLNIGTVLGAVALGVIVAWVPSMMSIWLLAFVALAVAAVIRPRLVETVLVVALLAGPLVLDYGFANLGIRTDFAPIPATELLLIPLVLVALLSGPRMIGALPILILTFLLLTVMRLIADFPRWGVLAMRDSTTAIEMTAIFVGYRALLRDGLVVWISRLRVLFFIVLLYAALFPWRESLAAIGPIVGLQQDVPLLGSMVGTGMAAAAAGLYLGVFTKGPRRAIAVACSVALLGVFQFRGLYIAVFAAILVLGWAHRQSAKILVAGSAAMLLAFALLGAVTQIVELQGRLGPVSTEFYSTHVRSLVGGAGPGEDSVSLRATWTRQVFETVADSPLSLAVGVGLGPDLAFGFRAPQVSGQGDVAVRKPHNDYLEILGRTGLVGLTIFIAILGTALRPLARAARMATGVGTRFCAWALATSSLYLVMATTQPSLAFPYGTIPLFFWLGMGLAAANSMARHQPLMAGSPQAKPPTVSTAATAD